MPYFSTPQIIINCPLVVTPSIKLRVEKKKKVLQKLVLTKTAHLRYLSLFTTFHLVAVQVHRTGIVGTEKSAFAEECFSPPRHDDAAAAVCCWYPVNVGRVD